MPVGYSLRVSLAIRPASSLRSRPLVRFSIRRIEIDAVDDVQGVHDVALGLGHLLPLLVAHEGVDVDVVERDLLHEVEAHHHHARDPEEDDVEAGDEHAGGIEARELRASGRASPRVENGQSAEENQVSRTSSSRTMREFRPRQCRRLRLRHDVVEGSRGGGNHQPSDVLRSPPPLPSPTRGEERRRSASWRQRRPHPSDSATKTLPSGPYHAGIWWPHQSWREMHQGWMLRIHSK